MKTLSILIVAMLLGLGGAAMAGDSGEAHQDNGNATGFTPQLDGEMLDEYRQSQLPMG
jgi:hypothetical protein